MCRYHQTCWPRSRVNHESPLRHSCLFVVCDSISATLKKHLSSNRDHTLVYLSAASLCEVVIKIQVKELSADPEELFTKIGESGFQELPVSVAHTLALERLLLHHRDPFDRILLAQAHAEHLRLLTADAGLKLYGPVCQMIAQARWLFTRLPP